MLPTLTLLKGVAIGLLAAVPVGPVGILCIQRTLSKGKISGFISGMGAAVVDAFYGAVAAFGLVVIIDFLKDYQIGIKLVGVVFLLYFGVKSWKQGDQKVNCVEKGTDAITDFFSALVLTATNPTTVVTFGALFAMTVTGFSSGSYQLASILVAGVFLGSTLWWFVLCFGVEQIRNRVSNFSFDIINKISGIITILFAIGILLSVLFGTISRYPTNWYNPINDYKMFYSRTS